MTMITLDDALHSVGISTWIKYFKQCRVTAVKHQSADFSDENNPVEISFREIPQPADMTKQYPEISIQTISVPKETFAFKGMMEALPKDHHFKSISNIEKATADFHDSRVKMEDEFQEWQEYKKNGNLKIETVDDTKPITWESIRNATTEELFQTKLEIFESPPVQDTDKKEYRSAIRKASSIIEAMYWYYLIVNDIKVSESSESSEEKIPEDISLLLEDIPSESIFKWKLQIFEREEVQNSENKKARSKIRKATNLVELFSAYAELTIEDKKE